MKDKSKCIILLIFPEYFKECKTSYNKKNKASDLLFFYSVFLVYVLVVIQKSFTNN